MRINKICIKNYRSIKDSGEIQLGDKLFVLAGQNESGKSSILEALEAYERDVSDRDNLNFELENKDNWKQEISCTYTNINETFYTNISDELFKLIKKQNKDQENLDIENVLRVDSIKNIKEFTLTRIFDFSETKMKSNIFIDKGTLGIIKGLNLHTTNLGLIGPYENVNSKLDSYLDVESCISEIAEFFFNEAPKIILFNDFTTLLPDKYLIEDLNKENIEGYKAVKNLEGLLQQKFSKIAKKATAQKISATETESNKISANFQEDWQQKIYGSNKVDIKFSIENNDKGKQEISFFIVTKKEELLAPRNRSKGMIWFLSLWLELKAKENEDSLILLFDEPGLHLHIKANQDMLKVFRKLNEKNHQIIYSTHSPALIDTDNLHNIGLVINDFQNGTLVEGLTTSKINSKNKKDALYPIAEAMGVVPLKDFSVLKEKNVLLEGLSDYWYLKGMSNLLNIKPNYEFIPGIGIKNNKIFHLISFCIGYGLDWLLIMDKGENPKSVKDELTKNLFDGDNSKANEKILLLKYDDFEDHFNLNDLILIDPSISVNSKKQPVEIIGNNRKIIFSKMFFQKVFKGEIKKEQFDPNTISNFEEIFKWIGLKFTHN